MESSKILEEGYRFCKKMGDASGSSFRIAFPLLPKAQCQAMYVLYAYMRLVDNLVDDGRPLASNSLSDSAGFGESPALTVEEKRERIGQLRSMLQFGFQNDRNFMVEPLDTPTLLDADFLFATSRILPVLFEEIERYRIPHEPFFAALDGVEMDLSKNRFATFEELQLYCERVASSVGLACIHIWGFRGRDTSEEKNVREWARQVGIAYQLTNILRDLKEDADLDRVYLPLDELDAAGYSVEELKNGVVNPAFHSLMERQIARAEEYFRAAEDLFAVLTPKGKKIFGLMTTIYRGLLRNIAKHPPEVFSRRIRLSSFRLLGLAVKWICFSPKGLSR